MERMAPSRVSSAGLAASKSFFASSVTRGSRAIGLLRGGGEPLDTHVSEGLALLGELLLPPFLLLLFPLLVTQDLAGGLARPFIRVPGGGERGVNETVRIGVIGARERPGAAPGAGVRPAAVHLPLDGEERAEREACGLVPEHGDPFTHPPSPRRSS